MASATVSGLGRNGPWLQNQWLRVETRLSDCSVSPVGLAGAFRPTERALASVELSDGTPILPERADYDVKPHADELGAGRRLTLTSRDPRRRVVLRREVVLYDDRPDCVVRLGVTNESATALPIDVLHVFTAPSEGRGRVQIAPAEQLRVYRHGWQSWSPTMSLGGTQMDVQSRPPELAPDPPQQAPGHFASDDVAVMHDPQSGRSLLAGAVTARDFLTQIFIDAPAKHIDARCLTDGIALQPGETLWSERIAIDATGGPVEQLERYGDALGRLMGARVPSSTPSGWCSWYYFFTQVTEDDVVRNLRFLEQHRRELPVQTVQIDDGYQADIGDWLTANEKFPRGMDWLASEVRRAGYTPGIWLAPFLVAESSKLFAEHPDWVVHDGVGDPAVASHNWQRRNFGIDGSHPDARAWLTSLFREVCDGWGYDYVKVDFLYGGAITGRRSDPRATRIRAYRQALEAVRTGVGEHRFILGCGSLMAPSVGVFDGNRIGNDVAPFWRFLTTDERARPEPRPRAPDDQLSAETAIRGTMNRAWMHGRLWANDPDCVLVRTDRTKLSLEECRTLASVIGLSGGMVLSSDDLDKVPAERIDMLSMLLPPLPRAASAAGLLEQDMPERFEVTFDRDFDQLRVTGLFNFDDAARDLLLPLPNGEWHAFELWSERYLGLVRNELRFEFVEPHGCRVVALRSVSEHPSVVGTTAHVGCGALDITNIAWHESAGVLSVELAPAGKRARRVIVANGGRTPFAAHMDGAETLFEPSADTCSVDVAVDRAANLEIQFR